MKPVFFCTCGSAACRKLGARDIRAIKPIDLMWYDVTGFEEGIEYQILDTTNQTHIKVSACRVGSLRTSAHCLGHDLIVLPCMQPTPHLLVPLAAVQAPAVISLFLHSCSDWCLGCLPEWTRWQAFEGLGPWSLFQSMTVLHSAL